MNTPPPTLLLGRESCQEFNTDLAGLELLRFEGCVHLMEEGTGGTIFWFLEIEVDISKTGTVEKGRIVGLDLCSQQKKLVCLDFCS